MLNFLDHFGNAVWPEKRRPFTLFDFANTLSNLRTAVKQAQQLLVNGVDLNAQVS